ncbi:uncharacterized protein [Elaeis guineensis]|uniref:uncharacterized protein n=1 Tax=Elaeis guineensis var. tenera TaxID=51953 RepID=UPI003C6D2310
MDESQITSPDKNDAWIIKIEKKKYAAKTFGVEQMWKSHKIFKVPERIQRESPEHYQPKVVAISPYHGQFQAVVQGRKQVGNREARRYYSEDVSMDSQSFLEMLPLDSFFIFYAFYLLAYPFTDEEWPLEQIMLDLLMLENQIPFFVLLQLYHGINEHADVAGTSIDTFVTFATATFRRRFLLGNRHLSIHEEVFHLLDLFRLSLYPAEHPEAQQDPNKVRDISEIPM